jgi:hypothetical protein
MRKLVLAAAATVVLSSGAGLAQGVPPSVLRATQIHPSHAIFEPDPNATGKTGWFANLLGLGHPEKVANSARSEMATTLQPGYRQ